MSLIRNIEGNDFFAPLQLHQRLGRLLQDFETETGLSRPANTLDLYPSLDVHDGEKQITVRADLPGMKKEDIKIDLHDQKLVIWGESKAAKEYEEKGWKVRERSFGKFERSILLPKGIDDQNVSASYENGVLEVKVGKKAEAAARKSITIH
jgi:HSP20 family protein